jgi:TRAP-type C4-dicarboxylate transport system permease small subunit
MREIPDERKRTSSYIWGVHLLSGAAHPPSVDTFIQRCCALLEALIALALAAMVVMVFGNVVLRYAFNSGITVSEELSRWCFVWLTFLGAIVGLRERAHLGTDVLIGRLGPGGQRLCLGFGQAAMLAVSIMFTRGSWEQTRINLDVQAPVTGAPVAVVYASGLVFGAAATLLLAADLWRTLSGRLGPEDLRMVRESEDRLGEPAPAASGAGAAEPGPQARPEIRP